MTNYSLAIGSDASINISQNWATIEETALECIDDDSV